MKKILITGATGFVGKYLAPALVKKYAVFCLARKTSDTRNIPKSAKIRYGDLLSEKNMYDATVGMNVVIHLGASVQSVKKIQNYSTNVEGTKILVDVCRKNNVKKLIYVSSVNASFKKRGAYGESKRLGEEVVKNSGIPHVILRPTMIYGVGDVGLSQTINVLKKSSVIPIIGNVKSATQPVYIEDVVSAITNAISLTAAINKTYLIAGASFFTLKEYFEKISSILNMPPKKFVRLPSWPFKIIIKFIELFGKKSFITYEQFLSMTEEKDTNIERAKNDLKFNPIDFETGLKNLIEKTDYFYVRG